MVKRNEVSVRSRFILKDPMMQKAQKCVSMDKKCVYLIPTAVIGGIFMKYSFTRRIMAGILVFSLLLPVAADATAGQNGISQDTNENTKGVISSEESAGIINAVSIEELTSGSQILKYIDEEVLIANQHVVRLPEEETLSSYAFLNMDGTMTVYYMDKAVKFVDKSGQIVEKDVSVASTRGGFTTAANDVGLHLPSDPETGISLSYGNYCVTLIPEGGALRKAARNSEDTVLYPNYFGAGASLMYTPTLDGLKEDIVLSQYTGMTSFVFRLFTDGLRIYQENGHYYLAQSADAKVRIDMGDVVAFDARGRFSVGSMAIETVEMGQEYVLTLSVDEAFLTDENTVYPVSIDPTLTVSDNTHGAGAIEDITLYSGAPNANCDWPYLHCGYYDSTYKIARTMFRLTGLLSSSTYQSATVGEITSAQFYIKEATGTAALPVYIHANTGSATWTETGATWNNAGCQVGTRYATASPGVNQVAAYDITNLVKAWKNETESAQAGFVLASSNETTKDKAFYSSEATNTANRSYVVVEYEVGDSFSNAINIGSGQTVPVNITTGGEKRYFAFKPFATGLYTIQSADYTGDPIMWLYNVDCIELAVNDDAEAGTYNFAFTYHFAANVTYYIAVGHHGNRTGAYNLIISSNPSVEALELSDLKLGVATTANIGKRYMVECYALTAPITNYYMLHSYAGSGNPMIWIYRDDLTFLYSRNGNGGGDNFHADIYLTANTTYYIIIGHQGNAMGNCTFAAVMPTYINEYIYNVKNTYSDMILDIHGPGEQEKAHQWPSHTDSQGQWRITQEDDGTYTIRSLYGNQYYLGVSGSAVGVDNIILLPTASNNTRWNIYETEAHTLLFEPASLPGKVLYAPDTNAGTELQLAWFSLANPACQWRIAGYNSIDAFRVPERTIAIQCVGDLTTNSEWYPLIQAAVAAWNQSDSGVNIILTNTESCYKFQVLDEQPLPNAELVPGIVTGEGMLLGGIIKIYAGSLDDQNNQYRIATIAHEIGHLFGLLDYEYEESIFLGDNSLMSYHRNHGIIDAPQDFDIRNIFYQYG